jgi:tetratricopeptide (TPR) repeat protein
VESEEQLIARLLAEEAAQDAPVVPQAAPEIDLTDTLDALDQPAAEAAPPPEPAADDARQRARAGAHEGAEAAFEEAELAGALGQIADAERLYAEAAAAGPFRFRSAAALGRLLDQEGRLVEAIEWFERATEVPAPDRDAGHALLYALGDALERHGESMRALAIFMELNAEAGDYRGVAARVERLARAEIGG